MQLQRIIRLLLSLLILIALLLNINLYQAPFLQQLENWTYDARLNFTLPNTVGDKVVIVDIDEISLTNVGRFPWKRDVMAKLVTHLFDFYQIKTLGFDIVFAEKDTSSGLQAFNKLANNELKNNQQYLATLEKLRPSLEFDQLFSQSLKGRDVVLGYYFRTYLDNKKIDKIGELPLAISQLTDEWSQRLPIFKAEGFGANLDILQQAAKSGGFFNNPAVGADGVFRRVPLIQSHEKHLYSSLSLATARLALDNPKIELIVETNGQKNSKDYFALEAINLGQYRIPVDHNGSVYVPYRGTTGSFKYISAYKILDKTADPNILKNKIVLLHQPPVYWTYALPRYKTYFLVWKFTLILFRASLIKT